MERTRAATAICALLVAAACSSSGHATAPTATTASKPADCDPARNGLTSGPNTLTFGGEQRSYLLQLPTAYDGRSFAPLVFDFHGFGSNGPAQDARTAMGAAGAARGFIVVTPTSDPPQWNVF